MMDFSWIAVQQNQANFNALSFPYQTVQATQPQQQPKIRKYTIENRMKKQKIWSPEEDALVLKFRFEGLKWNNVAAKINEQLYNGRQERRGKQCRERFNNHIDPNLKREQWTEQEDEQLVRLYKQLNSKWAIIAKQIQGRTENQVRNRIKALLKKDPELTVKQTQTKIGMTSFSSLASDVKQQYDKKQETQAQQQIMGYNQSTQPQMVQLYQPYYMPVTYVVPQMALITNQIPYLTPVIPMVDSQCIGQFQIPLVQNVMAEGNQEQATPNNSLPRSYT